MNTIAMWIGYAAMAAGGLALAACILRGAHYLLQRNIREVRATMDLRAAVKLWRDANPDKWEQRYGQE